MNRFLSKGLIALLLTSTATTIALPGFSAPAPHLNAGSISQPASSPREVGVPIITASGVLGPNHFIRVAVNGMTLKTLMVSIPEQMERYDKVRILDQSGKDVAAQISVNNRQLAIAFDQPVTPGGSLEVLFSGVQMREAGGETLLYGVTAERVGLQGEIPVGTARIQLPSRS